MYQISFPLEKASFILSNYLLKINTKYYKANKKHSMPKNLQDARKF